MTSRDYDVVIAGGGMIGSSLALALAPLGLRIAVVEAVARTADTQPSFDDRTTALSRSTQRAFEAMGLWSEIRAASTPIRHIHVSEQGRFAFSRIDAEEQGVAALGYVVINRVLGQVLQSALAESSAIDVICPGAVIEVNLNSDQADVVVQAEDNARINLRAGLLVVADGARSTVRDLIGIGAQHDDYGQCAVIGNLVAEKAMAGRAFERFTQRGTLALLPMTDERTAFVWAVGKADADHLLALPDDRFTAELRTEFGARLGDFSRIGKRAAYPLGLSRSLRLTAQRSVVVGNAAHGLHPVAAQGFNLGMRDVAALADCLADCIKLAAGTIDIGNEELLARYAAWRRDDQQKLLHFTDGLVQLFATRRRPIRWLRRAGMLAFDLVPGVRNEFARQTMGLSGRLPRLSRGVPLSS